MRRFWRFVQFVVALLFLAAGVTVAFVTVGCSAEKPEPRLAAAVVAVTANQAQSHLINAQVDEAIAAIDAVSAEGGTRRQAEDAVATVNERWEPIWESWHVFELAHDAWRTALESGDDSKILRTAIAARKAYCELSRLVTDLPRMPGGCEK